jgi:hypothetical protein
MATQTLLQLLDNVIHLLHWASDLLLATLHPTQLVVLLLIIRIDASLKTPELVALVVRIGDRIAQCLLRLDKDGGFVGLGHAARVAALHLLHFLFGRGDLRFRALPELLHHFRVQRTDNLALLLVLNAPLSVENALCDFG